MKTAIFIGPDFEIVREYSSILSKQFDNLEFIYFFQITSDSVPRLPLFLFDIRVWRLYVLLKKEYTNADLRKLRIEFKLHGYKLSLLILYRVYLFLPLYKRVVTKKCDVYIWNVNSPYSNLEYLILKKIKINIYDTERGPFVDSLIVAFKNREDPKTKREIFKLTNEFEINDRLNLSRNTSKCRVLYILPNEAHSEHYKIFQKSAIDLFVQICKRFPDYTFYLKPHPHCIYTKNNIYKAFKLQNVALINSIDLAYEAGITTVVSYMSKLEMVFLGKADLFVHNNSILRNHNLVKVFHNEKDLINLFENKRHNKEFRKDLLNIDYKVLFEKMNNV